MHSCLAWRSLLLGVLGALPKWVGMVNAGFSSVILEGVTSESQNHSCFSEDDKFALGWGKHSIARRLHKKRAKTQRGQERKENPLRSCLA
jgi:hypothetical protein